MHISNIGIENFRLFKIFSLDLDPGLNVLVGENNSGKTALIDAIRLTLDTNSAEWTRISETDFCNDSASFMIRLKFENIASEQAYVFVEHLTHEEVSDGGRSSVLYVNLIANLTDSLHRGNRFIRTELRSGANAEGPAIEREIREYLSATYLKPLRDAEAELSAGRASRLAQILSSSREMKKAGNLQKLLTDFIQANQLAKNNPGITASRASIEEHFHNLTFEGDKNKFQLAIQIMGSKDFDQLSESEKLRAFQDILERLSLTLDESVPLQGLGYNNILFMATELILLEQEAGQFPLLLIEEPEAHLHPQLQMKLLKYISDEYSSVNNPTIQTVLSTHSPNLASKAPLDSIILMKDGVAYPMRRGATKLGDADYYFLQKFLDVTKANLFFAKGVLIVEGDAENILVPTLAELLGRPLENYGVSIVNVGGTAYARYAKIFIRPDIDGVQEKWLPVPVACLRDLDLWPEAADKELGGFKTVKERNKQFWERRTNSAGEQFGTNPTAKRRALESFIDTNEAPDGTAFVLQNVKVCISEKWTFEYCLALSQLAPLLYEALTGSNEGFDALDTDVEKRAIQLYGMIDNKSGAKTDIAYKLTKILGREYGIAGRKEDLKRSIPQYIVDAVEHVTGPWPDDLDAEQKGVNVIPGVGMIIDSASTEQAKAKCHMLEIDVSDADIDELITEHNALVSDARKHWKLDAERRHVIKTWGDVQACPGSGKTTLVAAKLLILAKKWKDRYRGICVITHTNVARNEIISRLRGHPSGFKLVTYPHFIGTIQEFVNRYLGLPFCRSKGYPATRIDDDVCAQAIERSIGYRTKSYLDRRHSSVRELRLIFENNDLCLSVPGFTRKSTSNSYMELERAKDALIQGGLFFFSEMYAFANKLLIDNPNLIHSLRKRFPVVLIDEMQDTQKYQDAILQNLFFDDGVYLQRFGDPDQAIFDNMGGDEPNDSYNDKHGLHKIQTTHRFGQDICEKIRGLSYNGLDQLSSVREPIREDVPHTIFIYNDDTQGSVLDAFGDLLLEIDTLGTWHCVKAVGGVDGESGQIRKYWQKFDKSKATTSPKPKNLISIQKVCMSMTEGHVSSVYNLLAQGVVDLLRIAGVRVNQNSDGRAYYSQQTLVRWLKQNDKYMEFKQCMATLIMEHNISESSWAAQMVALASLLELNSLNLKAAEYLSFGAKVREDSEIRENATNKYIAANGREMEVGTIHSVKGETHDATLILETKFNRWFDVLEMLPFMLDATMMRPAFVPNANTKESTLAQYMRKLYVAGSRPRHLLCVAIHENHIREEHLAALQEQGWRVTTVPRVEKNG